MPSVSATLRFGARPSSRVPIYTRGDSVSVWADFRDVLTGALVDVSGVAARVWLPGGALLDPPLTPVEEAAGTWRVDVTPDYSGTWRVELSCTTPDAAVDVRSLSIVAPEPDGSEPIAPTVADVDALVVRIEAAADSATADAAAADADRIAAAASAAAAQAARVAAEAAAAAVISSLLIEAGPPLLLENGTPLAMEI
jgi:hypothetical protein